MIKDEGFGITLFAGGEDNGGHGTDQRDIEDGDGKGGSGSPGH
ncbi:hypothetical protein [Streptomyces mutomycini]